MIHIKCPLQLNMDWWVHFANSPLNKESNEDTRSKFYEPVNWSKITYIYLHNWSQNRAKLWLRDFMTLYTSTKIGEEFLCLIEKGELFDV